jgi:chitin disaccharide deacetylase
MPTLLIVNADDFGAGAGINAAVARARAEGVLTSASLMVTGDAADEAVRIARADAGLAVGLHLALSDARSALTQARLDAHPAVAGLRYSLHGPSRRRLRAEVQAQFDAFAQTGLPLSHVDGHQHLHAHPAVLPIVLELAAQHGARGIRVPRDPIWLNLRLDRSAPAHKAGAALATAFLSAVCERRLRGSTLACCDYAIGSLMCGMMNPGFAIGALSRLRCRSVELFCHPATGPGRVPLGPNRGDLDALLSPELKDFISAGDWRLTNYAGLLARDEEVHPEPA